MGGLCVCVGPKGAAILTPSLASAQGQPGLSLAAQGVRCEEVLELEPLNWSEQPHGRGCWGLNT